MLYLTDTKQSSGVEVDCKSRQLLCKTGDKKTTLHYEI